MICSFCKKRPAVYSQKYSGQNFCKSCFCNSIEKKVAKTITKYKMLSKNDQISIGLSGGKDSISLTYIMNKMAQRYQNFSINTITVDEGIKGYRDNSFEIIDKFISDLNLEHHYISYKELFGYTLDEIVDIFKKRGETEIKACSYCGVLRRRALNIAARELGATKLATAHNIDDEAETILMNVTRSDMTRILRYEPVPFKKHPTFVPRIKPFREIPEKEIVLYAYFRNLTVHSTECPYSYESMRRNIKNAINILEEKNPSVKFSLLKFQSHLFQKANEDLQESKDFKTCAKCSDPTSSDVCKFCQLMEKVLGI